MHRERVASGGRPVTSDAHQLDAIASWLGLGDPEPEQAVLMLLFGRALPSGWDRAAATVQSGRVGTRMLVGGQGHTTDVLRRLVEAGPEAAQADLLAAPP
jgi:hypothetical protein